MGTLANSEDKDEIQHNVAFHQGLHYLSGLKQSSRTDEGPLKYTRGSSILLYQYVWENTSENKGLN